MRILILTGKFGMGHYSAALSLGRELRAAFPGAEVEVEDFFAYALRGASEAVYKFFDLLVSRGSGLYNVVYRLTENGRGDAVPMFALPLMDGMVSLLKERRPQVVIATHPTCAQLLSRCKEDGTFQGVFLTCVTDVTAHSEWLCHNCDAYLVGAPQTAREFARKGVDPERILVTGIPVRPEFKQPACREEAGERRLLIMGGGLGLVPRQESFYRALDAMPGVKTTLIAGNNQKLRDRLAGRYGNIQVLGYTDRVYEYMASAHLMLSKPGGITVFEAIFSRLPILAWEPFLEQERRNANFLVRNGIGRIAPKEPEGCLESVRKLLFDRPALERMSRGMEALQGELATQGLERLIAALEPRREVRCG